MVTGSVQAKNGKYYAVLNYKDDFGKRRQKWICTGYTIRGNKKKAERFLDEQLAAWNEKDIRYCDLTVDKYFENWLEEIRYEVKPNTYRGYCGNMKNHIIPYFKAKKLLIQELKPYHLEEYYRYKLKPNSKLNNQEALSHATIKHHHQNISKALADAVRKGIIHYNPAASARTPKAESFKGNFLNPAQINDLLILFKGSAIELPVTLAAVYGFRRSEVLGLKWSHIDFVNKTITICETLQQGTGGNYTDTPKTESSYRTLPMTDDVYKLLEKHREMQAQKRKLLGNYYNVNDYVCTLDNGQVISPNYLSRTFHSTISKSSLPLIRFHDLRHSVASNLLNKGFSVVQVAEWLGHSSSSTTLKFYAHNDKTSKLSIANSLENMIAV